MKKHGDSTIEEAIGKFVSDLHLIAIPSWIRKVVHFNFRFRLDLEQIANDSAFAIFRYLTVAYSNHGSMELDQPRRQSYRITCRVTLNAIKHAKRQRRSIVPLDFYMCDRFLERFDTTPSCVRDVECKELLDQYLNSSSVERRLLIELLTSGFSNAAIAIQTHISVRQLQRTLKSIEREIVDLLTQSASSRQPTADSRQ